MAMEEFNKKKNDLEEQKVEAEASFDGEKVSQLEQQIADLEAKKHTYEDVVENAETGASENQLKQVEDLGGDVSTLNQKLEEANQKVEKVEEVVESVPNGDIDHKVNAELEPGSHTEVIAEQEDSEQVLYKDISSNLSTLKKEYGELSAKKDALLSERNKAEQIKDTKKIDEINAQMTEITEQQKVLNNKEGGIYELENKKKEIRREFKKSHGFDSDLNMKIKNEYTHTAGQDAQAMFLNKLIGLDLPVFSKDFSLDSKKEGKKQADFGNSNEGSKNKELLVKKQLELYKQYQEALDTIRQVSDKDALNKLFNNHKIDFDVLEEGNNYEASNRSSNDVVSRTMHVLIDSERGAIIPVDTENNGSAAVKKEGLVNAEGKPLNYYSDVRENFSRDGAKVLSRIYMAKLIKESGLLNKTVQ